MSLNLFTATLDEAMADADPEQIVRWGAAQRLLVQREHFEANPLHGVDVCAQHGLPMPAWLADAFHQRFARVMGAEAGSWDEAFGRPYPKGAQLARVQQRMKVRGAIFRDVTEALLLKPPRPLSAGLFDEIGMRHNVSKTVAETIYREACKHFGYGGKKTARAIRRAQRR